MNLFLIIFAISYSQAGSIFKITSLKDFEEKYKQQVGAKTLIQRCYVELKGPFIPWNCYGLSKIVSTQLEKKDLLNKADRHCKNLVERGELFVSENIFTKSKNQVSPVCRKNLENALLDQKYQEIDI